MNIRSIIALSILTACSFQASAISITNGGFENGMSGWGGLTETFGFAEVVSSYTDITGTTYLPTEGTHFLNFWGNEDRAQTLSWSKGDQISFDYATTEAAYPYASSGLFFGVFSGLSPLQAPSFSHETPVFDSPVLDSLFKRVTYTFTQNSPSDSLIAFQAQGISPGQGLTNQEVGHILIDNIQVSSIPLPTAFFMFVPALVGLLSLRRKTLA